MNARHLTFEELMAGLPHIERSPKDGGLMQLIVRRPGEASGSAVRLENAVREVLHEAQLDVAEGLVGDTWNQRSSTRTKDGSPHPDRQLTIMNARAIALLARSDDRWALAGDQLYLDLDLTDANLPAGTRLALGSAVIEVTAELHTGCDKFASRFGVDATRFVNSDDGRRLHMRGIYAKVVQTGTIRVGDPAIKR